MYQGNSAGIARRYLVLSLSGMITATIIASANQWLAAQEQAKSLDVSDSSTTNSQSPPVVFTAQQDHQNMMQQLGITQLRRGRDSDQNSPHAANYDEAKANPFPDLPDPLVQANGEKVVSSEQWSQVRRPEIVELLEREPYGRIPANVPTVTWEVRETREIVAGGVPAIQKHIVGVVDNSGCPEIEVNISLALTLPKSAAGPVPVLLSFGWTPFEPSPFPQFRRPEGDEPQPPSREDVLLAAGWGGDTQSNDRASRCRWMATASFWSRCVGKQRGRTNGGRTHPRDYWADQLGPTTNAGPMGCAASLGLGWFHTSRS